MSDKRISHLDVLKCMGIIMVVMYHIDHAAFNYLAPNLNNALYNFYLPVFFFVSGIFFSPRDGFGNFLRSKVNGLVVPFVFFVFFAYLVRLTVWSAQSLVGMPGLDISPMQLVQPFYLRYWPNTAPLWFLPCLFWIHIIFYWLHRLIKPWWGIVLAAAAISVAGYCLATNRLQLPLMLDISMVALPYFVLGWGVKRLGALASCRWDWLGLVALLVVAYPVYRWSDFTSLHFMALPAYWKLYVLPFAVLLAAFWASKPLPRVPVLGYFGRYTLIILGTHQLILQPVRSLLQGIGMEAGFGLVMAVLVVTLLVEWPLIRLLAACFPRFTAQAPFFKPGWKLF